MFSSIGALVEGLMIIISNNIRVLYSEFVLVRAKHLCDYNIVDSTHHSTTASRLEVGALVKGNRARARSSRSNIKACMSRCSNSSLLEYRELRRGGLEKVSSGGHDGCRCGLLVFSIKRENV